MCITITVGETGRRVMGLSTTVLNIVLVFLSLNLFIAAVGIRYKLDKRLELMNGYDSGALPFYMMVTGGLMFFCHLVAIKFCYDATNVETRSDKHHLFVALIFVIMGMFLLIFINIIIILVHAGKIRSSLEEGIGGSMKAYKSDLARKLTMDNVQTEFECCGVKSYKDWFQIGWVNLMYINTDSDDVKRYLKGGEFIKDDAPFSCCSPDSKRACVHHSVLDFKIHRNYEAVNLNNVGCVDAVMAYFKAALIVPTALLLFIILILEAIDIVVMRMLQTSIFTADEINDPEAATEAYCIKGLGGGGDVRELFRRKKDDDEDDVSDSDDDYEKSKSRSKKRKRRIRDDDDDDDDDDEADDQPRSRGGGRGGFSRGDDTGGGGGYDGDDYDRDEDRKDKKKKGKKDKKDKKKDKEEQKKKKNENKDKKKEEKKKKQEEKKKKKEDKKKKNQEKKQNKKDKKKKEPKKKTKKPKKPKKPTKPKKPKKPKKSKSKGGKKK